MDDAIHEQQRLGNPVIAVDRQNFRIKVATQESDPEKEVWTPSQR